MLQQLDDKIIKHALNNLISTLIKKITRPTKLRHLTADQVWTDPCLRRVLAYINKTQSDDSIVKGLNTMCESPAYFQFLNQLNDRNCQEQFPVCVQGQLSAMSITDGFHVETALLRATLHDTASRVPFEPDLAACRRTRTTRHIPWLAPYASKRIQVPSAESGPFAMLMFTTTSFVSALMTPIPMALFTVLFFGEFLYALRLKSIRTGNKVGALLQTQVSPTWDAVFEENTLADALLCGLLLTYDQKFGRGVPLDFLSRTPGETVLWLSAILDTNGMTLTNINNVHMRKIDESNSFSELSPTAVPQALPNAQDTHSG